MSKNPPKPKKPFRKSGKLLLKSNSQKSGSLETKSEEMEGGSRLLDSIPYQQEMHFLVSVCSQLIIPALFMSNIAADFLLHLGKICLIYSLLVFKKNICIQKQQPYQTEVVKLRSTIWKPQKVFPTDLVCRLGSGFPVTKLLHIIGHLSFYASTPQKVCKYFFWLKT